MEKQQAPHEKLTDEEVKEEIENLLKSHLKLKGRWDASDWEVHEFDEFMKEQDHIIFKLRRHFSPELTTIIKLTLGELTEMMSNTYGDIKLKETKNSNMETNEG